MILNNVLFTTQKINIGWKEEVHQIPLYRWFTVQLSNSSVSYAVLILHYGIL